jgi:formylglycine-generating enzyme required for sulfatase activity
MSGAAALRVAPGEFQMGSPTEEVGRSDDEVRHNVRITLAFQLKATDVTQAEWLAVMGVNPSGFTACGENCPVENITWWDAAAYCNMLSKREGLPRCYDLIDCRGTAGNGLMCSSVSAVGGNGALGCTGYRMPTEAEWEYAARAADSRATYGERSKIAWWNENAGGSTHPVAQLMANRWGLSDMLGNAWQWVWDWYGPYGGDGTTDPAGPAAGSWRVARGGGWSNHARFIRAARRGTFDPDDRGFYIGFRPARSGW